MKTRIILLFISISYLSIGQNIYPIVYNDCITSQFFLEGKEINAAYDDKMLIDDIIKSIEVKTLNKIKGTIYFQVVIDTLGNHCCVSIKDELNSKGKKIDFKSIIDNHTKWSIPIRKEKKTTVAAMIRLEFEKEKIILKRMGYNGKIGWIELSKYELIKNK